MYVCICNAIRESDLETAIARGTKRFAEFSQETGCSGTCGTCKEDAESLFNAALKAHKDGQKNRRPFGLPVFQTA
jgi:bacterioferritin-associated ferredoxin